MATPWCWASWQVQRLWKSVDVKAAESCWVMLGSEGAAIAAIGYSWLMASCFIRQKISRVIWDGGKKLKLRRWCFVSQTDVLGLWVNMMFWTRECYAHMMPSRVVPASSPLSTIVEISDERN